jgi:hypothetical protein
MEVEYSFLLVKNDEYIRKKCIDDILMQIFTRENDKTEKTKTKAVLKF